MAFLKDMLIAVIFYIILDDYKKIEDQSLRRYISI